MTDMLRAITPGTAPTSSPALSARPGGFDVLVLDASTRQSLSAVRSLGRAGLRVATAECYADCDPGMPVLASRSRYSCHTEILPNFAVDSVGFADAVVELVTRHPTPVVLPASDGTIAALRPRRAILERLGTRLALPSDSVLEVANDKDRTLVVARELGIGLPETLLIREPADLDHVLDRFRFPMVLKPAVSWAGRSAVRLQAVEVIDRAEAEWVTAEFLAAGALVLAQEWMGGRREGVSAMVVAGEVKALFAHVEHRTSPALGGASVLRESIAVPADLGSATLRLVAALGLDGLCEVEFRRDGAGRPLLMEVNARLAGPIEIAARCGVDFPLMLWRWTNGLDVPPVTSYREGVRMRWLRGDMRWLRDNFRRAGRPDSVSRAHSLWMFGSEFFRTTRYDCLDLSDLSPALAETRTTVAALRGRSRTQAGSQPPRLFNQTRKRVRDVN